jgi:tetratricopeptide (TPR) repeat protein
MEVAEMCRRERTWIVAGFAVVALLLFLALAGCPHNPPPVPAENVVPPAALTGAAATPANLTPAPAGTTFCEFCNPQSDDQSHYVPIKDAATKPIYGFVASKNKINSVTVNGDPAVTYPATYTPLGAPAGINDVGFRVPLYMEPDTVLSVGVVEDGGYYYTEDYYPAGPVVFTRLHALYTEYPDDVYLRLRLGNAFAFEADYGEAFPEYQAVIVARPEFALGFFFFGVACYDDDDWDDAIFGFNRCIAIEPDFFIGHYCLGESYFGRRDWDDADREFRSALAADPSFADAYWRRGQIYAARGDWPHAQEQYQNALRYNPRFAEAHRSLAEAYSASGHPDQALAEYHKVLQTNPRYAPAHLGTGAIQEKQGKLPEATKSYQRATEVAPRSAPAHTALAGALEHQGQKAQAAPHRAAAQSINAEHARVHQQAQHALAQVRPQIHTQASRPISHASRPAPGRTDGGAGHQYSRPTGGGGGKPASGGGGSKPSGGGDKRRH